MSLIKRILVYFYRTSPIRFIRSELARKLNKIISTSDLSAQLSAQKLNEIISTSDLSAQLRDLRQHQDSLFDNQNRYLNNVVRDESESFCLLKHLHAHADVKHDRQLFYLKNLFQNQGFNAYFTYRQELSGQFNEIMTRILGNDFLGIQQNIEQIFSEILIGHMNPGGIWKLKRDMLRFTHSVGTDAPMVTQPDLNRTKPPLKILIISGTFPSFMHGGGGRLFDIILELAKDHRIDLYTHYDEALDSASLEIIKDKVENIKTVHYPELTAEMVGAWLRSINRDTLYYDVVQLEYSHTASFIEPMQQYGKKVGFTFMECLSQSFTEKLEHSIALMDYDHISKISQEFWSAIAIERYALEKAHFCIAVTPEDSTFLSRLSKRSPHIIPTCVSTFSIIDKAKEYADIVPEENSVMFLGFFGHWPNIEAIEWYLRDIHPLVKAKIPTYKFYIVGSGDITRIEKLSAEDKTVIVTGRVDSVVPHILKARLCVSPLISGAGIRGKQNQYSLLNRPSVTTTIGNKGLKYVHEESVMVADEATGFASAIIRLLTEEELYAKLQRNAKQIAIDNYTWSSHLPKLVEIYNE